MQDGKHLSSDGVDTSNDGRGVGATDGDVVDLLAVLEEQEGGHGGDAVVGGNIRELVNVDLVELHVLLLGAKLLDGGGDSLAGSTPGGVEVDNDGLGGLLDEGLPLLSARLSSWLAYGLIDYAKLTRRWAWESINGG